jgi:hypothetical protein
VLVFTYSEFLDRLRDRALIIRLIVDDANELGVAFYGAVNAPGVAFRLLGRVLGHSATIAETAGQPSSTG